MDWVIDTSRPLVEITSHPQKLANTANAQFGFRGSDAGSGIHRFECQMDGQQFSACTSPINYGNLIDGGHTFVVRAIDQAGNVSTPARFQWIIDTEAPTLSLDSVPDNPTNNSSASFAFSGQDSGSGIAHYDCQIDGKGFTKCASPFSGSSLADGNHKFEVRAVDNAGNTSATLSHDWLVDTTPPTVEIVKQPSNPDNQTSAHFEYIGQDSGSGLAGYQCQIDGRPFTNCANTTDLSGVTEGNHTFAVRALDKAGNISAVAEYWWFTDLTGPVITFQQQPPALVFIGDTAMIEFTINDDSGVKNYQCQLQGQPINCTTGVALSIPATDVSNLTFQVSAEDTLGNTAVASLQWSTDYNYIKKQTLATVQPDRPVDLLFVVDNSGSMDDERANLAQRIDGLIDKVDEFDWQIAVISTDVTPVTNGDGRFIELIGLPGQYILDSNMDKQQAQDIFGNTVQNFGRGSAEEQGIWATKRAIDRFIAGENQHQNFFRDGADLNVVVLSDEDENSTGDNLQITPQNFLNFCGSNLGWK